MVYFELNACIFLMKYYYPRPIPIKYMNKRLSNLSLTFERPWNGN